MPAVPTEDLEQQWFVQWLTLKDLKHSAIPNSTYTTSWKQKAKNTRTGLHAGLPDLLVLVPPDRSVDGYGHAIFVEMKRIKGGVVSADQKLWIAALNDLDSPSVIAGVCKGADAAIELVGGYLL